MMGSSQEDVAFYKSNGTLEGKGGFYRPNNIIEDESESESDGGHNENENINSTNGKLHNSNTYSANVSNNLNDYGNGSSTRVHNDEYYSTSDLDLPNYFSSSSDDSYIDADKPIDSVISDALTAGSLASVSLYRRIQEIMTSQTADCSKSIKKFYLNYNKSSPLSDGDLRQKRLFNDESATFSRYWFCLKPESNLSNFSDKLNLIPLKDPNFAGYGHLLIKMNLAKLLFHFLLPGHRKLYDVWTRFSEMRIRKKDESDTAKKLLSNVEEFMESCEDCFQTTLKDDILLDITTYRFCLQLSLTYLRLLHGSPKKLLKTSIQDQRESAEEIWWESAPARSSSMPEFEERTKVILKILNHEPTIGDALRKLYKRYFKSGWGSIVSFYLEEWQIRINIEKAMEEEVKGRGGIGGSMRGSIRGSTRSSMDSESGEEKSKKNRRKSKISLSEEESLEQSVEETVYESVDDSVDENMNKINENSDENSHERLEDRKGVNGKESKQKISDERGVKEENRTNSNDNESDSERENITKINNSIAKINNEPHTKDYSSTSDTSISNISFINHNNHKREESSIISSKKRKIEDLDSHLLPKKQQPIKLKPIILSQLPLPNLAECFPQRRRKVKQRELQIKGLNFIEDI